MYSHFVLLFNYDNLIFKGNGTGRITVTRWAALESNSKRWWLTVLGKVITILGIVGDHSTVGEWEAFLWLVCDQPLDGG